MAELDRRHRAAGALAGVVTAIDVAAGLGTVRSDDGGEHRFHVIEIADGSRDISVDTAVTFDLLPKFGRYEAANLRPA